MMSNGSSSSLSLDHFSEAQPQSQNQTQTQTQTQLCYVHCNHCDTVLAVSVPSSSLFKTVTVRCGHCTNLLPVNLRALLLPPPPPAQFTLGHNFFSPSSHIYPGQMPNNQAPSFSLAQPTGSTNYMNPAPASRGGSDELQRAPPISNRPLSLIQLLVSATEKG